MLVLTRKPGEKIHIGDDIVVTIVEQRPGRIRVGIEAPKTVKVLREELMTGRGNEALERPAGGDYTPVLPPRS